MQNLILMTCTNGPTLQDLRLVFGRGAGVAEVDDDLVEGAEFTVP